MKTLRVIFILSIPVLGIVSCQKSDCRPAEHTQQSASSSVSDSKELARPINNDGSSTSSRSVINQDNSTPNIAARTISPDNSTSSDNSGSNSDNGGKQQLNSGSRITGNTSPNPDDIYGSGDDDRDGGDRRKKR